jgi:hypothetical protein
MNIKIVMAAAAAIAVVAATMLRALWILTALNHRGVAKGPTRLRQGSRSTLLTAVRVVTYPSTVGKHG